MVLFHLLSPSQQYELLARAWSKRMWLLLGTHKIILTLFLVPTPKGRQDVFGLQQRPCSFQTFVQGMCWSPS